MFLLRIGAEALKNVDQGLSNNCCPVNVKHSNLGKIKTNKCKYQVDPYGSNDKPVDQGILYNLLKKNAVQMAQLDANDSEEVRHRPNSSNLERVKCTPTKIVSNRPSSAPQSIRFHPYSKPKPYVNITDHNNNNQSDPDNVKQFYPDKLIVEWLRNIVRLMKPHQFGENQLVNVLQLPDDDRIRILKQSWHLIFITYLVEFIEKHGETTKSILAHFIKDYDKPERGANYKKLFRLTRVFTNDLEIVIDQMISLRLNRNLLQLLRIAILFTDNQEDVKKKNIELLKPRLGARSDEYHRLFDQLLDNLFKLDMSMIESVFCGHLFPSADGIIDELYWNL